MRQRNMSGVTVTVPEIPAEVEPGEVVDHPTLIVGFEPVPAATPKKKTGVSEAPANPAGTPATTVEE